MPEIKPGPWTVTWQVHDPLEALRMARARADYHDERYPDLRFTEHIVDWIARAEELIERNRATAEKRAEYLQHEINEMRRAMQAAGTWDDFCRDYAAYKVRRAETGPKGDSDA